MCFSHPSVLPCADVNRSVSVPRQTEPPSQQHVRIQKELWRIQDVMEALNKNKAERLAADGMNPYGPMTNFGKHRNEVRHRRQGSAVLAQ